MTLILSGTDGLSDVDGSAATPAIRGTDANTGIFFPAADQVAITTGGTQRAVVDASGNVGIGTSSLPGYRVSVKQSGNTGLASIGIASINSANDTYIGMGYHATSDTCRILASYDTNGAFKPITFLTSDAERMRIDSSGNVGIGVTPSAWGTAKAFQIGGSGFSLSSNGSGSGDGSLTWNGYYNGTNWIYSYTGGAASRFRLNESGAAWFTAPSGTAGNAITFTQAMTLDSSGNLLVGTTSATLGSGTGLKVLAGTDAAERMQIGSSITTNAAIGYSMYSTGAGAYRFYVGYGGTIYATSTTITATSDQRLKENIRDLDDGLEKVLALKPRKFDWKEGKGEDKKDARGFIAQEFEQVFPDMVTEWIDPAPEGEDPYKAVNANLIPTLVKAIQEQQALIQQLQADVAALKGNA